MPLKPQYDHILTSSLVLWTKHVLLKDGEAYINHSGYFYQTPNVFNGYYTYSLPFRPINPDRSIPGASIMSGIYVNGAFSITGQNNLVDINYNRGEVYFSSPVSNPQTSLSGNYSIEEFSVELTDQPDYDIISENKYQTRPKTAQEISGLLPDQYTTPIIFIKPFREDREEFSFGGTEKCVDKFRFIIMAENTYQLDGVKSILKDRVKTLVPFISGNALPFNNFGGLVNGSYNYLELTTGLKTSANSAFIEKVRYTSLPGSSYTNLRKTNSHLHVGIVEMELNSYRNTRP